MNSDNNRYIVITLPSIHHVLKAEKLLKKTTLPFELIPVPKEVNPDCGMAVQFEKDYSDGIVGTLHNAGLQIEAVYEREGSRFLKKDLSL